MTCRSGNVGVCAIGHRLHTTWGASQARGQRSATEKGRELLAEKLEVRFAETKLWSRRYMQKMGGGAEVVSNVMVGVIQTPQSPQGDKTFGRGGIGLDTKALSDGGGERGEEGNLNVFPMNITPKIMGKVILFVSATEEAWEANPFMISSRGGP